MITCKGSGRIVPRKQIKMVWSYESVDGKQHRFINCPVCKKELKVPHDFIVRHTPLPA